MRIEEEIHQDKFASARHKLIINTFFTANWLREQHTVLLRPFDITLQQFNILRILRGQAPRATSIGLLQERMLDRQPDVSRLVERLRLKGLLQRATSLKDRRSCEVTITEAGMALLAAIDRVLEAWFANLTTLSETEAEEASRILDQVRGSV
ncbi:MAG TPA: MarR family transcriptional regulator [bacterium]|nr:MarR family transcriptional regulator [bacterium]HQI47542.1 MarR family transcriptional regulator [bacterium]HQJ63118.1 MarR family transcriptional regulator [bacterium]